MQVRAKRLSCGGRQGLETETSRGINDCGYVWEASGRMLRPQGWSQERGDPEQEDFVAREGAAKWLLTSSL